MLKIFISVGMSGRSEDDVRKDIANAVFYLKHIMKGNDFEIVHNYDCVPPQDHEVGRLWYLGNAISKMDGCDKIFFTDGYDQHKGCLVEEYVAKLYNKDVIYQKGI